MAIETISIAPFSRPPPSPLLGRHGRLQKCDIRSGTRADRWYPWSRTLLPALLRPSPAFVGTSASGDKSHAGLSSPPVHPDRPVPPVRPLVVTNSVRQL